MDIINNEDMLARLAAAESRILLLESRIDAPASPRGDRRRRLTDEQVLAIRSHEGSIADAARLFGVSYGYAWQIRQGLARP